MPDCNRRRLLLTGAGLLAGTLPAAKALAQLRVDITRGQIEPMPIAVSRFAGAGGGTGDFGASIADVVAADLERSGLFRVIDQDAYIQSPEELRDIPRFADWRQINAQALVSGVVGRAGPDRLEVEFRLWDVFAGSQLRGLIFETDAEGWRRVAHRIADVVYERITGETGYFDSRIVYVSESGPAIRRVKRLAVMDQDGANHRFLTDGDDLVLTPRFAPDARRVAYLVLRTPAPQVHVRDIFTGRSSVLGDFQGMTFSPRFSPDGEEMLMTVAEAGNSDIYATDAAGRRPRRLTESSAIDTSPSFSPDGRRIAFNSDRGGSPQLYVMGRDGGGVQRISFGTGRYGSPAWSPRGDLIAFTKIQGGFFHIGVMEPDGSNERLLTRSFLDESPSWAPNGRVVLFARQNRQAERTRLFTIDITGYNEREVPTPLDASDPDWSPLIP